MPPRRRLPAGGVVGHIPEFVVVPHASHWKLTGRVHTHLAAAAPLPVSFQAVKSYQAGNWAITRLFLGKCLENPTTAELEKKKEKETPESKEARVTKERLDMVAFLRAEEGGNFSPIKEEPDGPAKRLLAYIKQFNYTAPSEWQGFRALTDK